MPRTVESLKSAIETNRTIIKDINDHLNDFEEMRIKYADSPERIKRIDQWIAEDKKSIEYYSKQNKEYYATLMCLYNC